jgi:hypothetical protein
MTSEALKALQEGRAPAGPAGSSLAPLDVPKLWALNANFRLPPPPLKSMNSSMLLYSD